MEQLFHFVFPYGLGLLALLLMLLAVLFARGKGTVIVVGIIAAILMVLQFLLLVTVAGVASATSGSQQGYRLLGIAFVVFLLSFAAYIPLANFAVERRIRRRSRKP